MKLSSLVAILICRSTSWFVHLLCLSVCLATPALSIDVDLKKGTLDSPSKPQPPAPTPKPSAAPEPPPSRPASPAPTRRQATYPPRNSYRNRQTPPAPRPLPKVHGCDSIGPIRKVSQLSPGVSVSCTLDKDSLIQGNRRLHLYQFQAAAGELIWIKLSLDTANIIGSYPYLEVQGPDKKAIASVDGANKRRIAEARLNVPVDGTYTLLISSVLVDSFGVGVQLGLNESTGDLVVLSLKEGSPASKMGVKPKDVLVAIDGRSTRGLTTDAAMKRLRGKPDSKVSLTLNRKDGSLAVLLKRELSELNEELESRYTLIVDRDQRRSPRSISSPSQPTSLEAALNATSQQNQVSPNALRRAVNMARMTAERRNGGLGYYHAAACMHQRGGGNCLIKSDAAGFLFRFQGGPPGWQRLRISPTKETQILVSPDGKKVLEYRELTR